MPSPIRRCALDTANALAETGATPRDALRNGIVRAWATQTTDPRSHHARERPAGQARFLRSEGDAWVIEALGDAKVVRCASFRWAVHRASAACERDNGAIYALLPGQRGLVSLSGVASLERTDIWVRPLRKGRWAVAQLDHGESVYQRFASHEGALVHAQALAEARGQAAWEWTPKTRERELLVPAP